MTLLSWNMLLMVTLTNDVIELEYVVNGHANKRRSKFYFKNYTKVVDTPDQQCSDKEVPEMGR